MLIIVAEVPRRLIKSYRSYVYTWNIGIAILRWRVGVSVYFITTVLLYIVWKTVLWCRLYMVYFAFFNCINKSINWMYTVPHMITMFKCKKMIYDGLHTNGTISQPYVLDHLLSWIPVQNVEETMTQTLNLYLIFI